MKGLLLKDYYLIKSSVWMMVIIIIPLTLLQLFLFKAVLLSVTPLLFAILFYLLANNTFSIDDSSKWNKISATFPVSPKILVGEKYVLHLLSILFGTVLGILINYIGTIVKPDFQISSYFNHVVILGIIMPLLAGTINLPLCYLFGKNATLSPVFLILSYVPAAVIGFAIRNRITTSEPSSSILIMLAFLGGTILFYLVSCCITYRAFRKRDI